MVSSPNVGTVAGPSVPAPHRAACCPIFPYAQSHFLHFLQASSQKLFLGTLHTNLNLRCSLTEIWIHTHKCIWTHWGRRQLLLLIHTCHGSKWVSACRHACVHTDLAHVSIVPVCVYKQLMRTLSLYIFSLTSSSLSQHQTLCLSDLETATSSFSISSKKPFSLKSIPIPNLSVSFSRKHEIIFFCHSNQNF